MQQKKMKGNKKMKCNKKDEKQQKDERQQKKRGKASNKMKGNFPQYTKKRESTHEQKVSIIIIVIFCIPNVMNLICYQHKHIGHLA